MNWSKVEEDVESGPIGTFKWIATAIIAFVILFGVLRAFGMIGSKVVERQVMKNSFQYVEGMQQRAAILQANLIEIDVQIQQDPSNSALLGQKRILRAQLTAITINQ